MSAEPIIRVLRKLWWPVVAQSWLQFVVMLFGMLVAVWKSEYGPLWAVGVILVLTLTTSYFQFAYRISYSDVAVIQKASGANRRIAFSDIDRVVLERASIIEMIRGGRPFRRVAIYSKGNGNRERYIDVSLRHFAGEDITALLESLRRHRPDLEIPYLDPADSKRVFRQT